MKLANFNRDYVETAFSSEGYYDFYNYGVSTMLSSNATKVLNGRRSGYNTKTVKDKTHYIYEFIFVPNLGFLADSLPLPKDCELRISFDRASPAAALLADEGAPELETLEIKDCIAMTEWVSSPALRTFFSDIENNPIVFKYEEVELVCKPLPMNETTVRLDNIRGGNIPSYIFAGIIPTEAITGEYSSSSTNFACNNVNEINITLNGYSVNGYPINITDQSGSFAQYQFNETVGRSYNVNCAAGLNKDQFKSNFIWATKFEAEETSQGWIGINMKLDKPFTTSHTMIIWLI